MASNNVKISPDKVAKSKAPFRYRWQKNGRFEYQDALIEADNADSTEDKNKAIRTKESNVMDDGFVRISNHCIISERFLYSNLDLRPLFASTKTRPLIAIGVY